MKITITYCLPVEKEIEISAEEYCNLRANTDSRPDIFPIESFNRSVPYYRHMAPGNQKELEDFWNRG